MGRLVTKSHIRQLSTSDDDEYLATPYVLPTDVSWKSAWVSFWRSPFQPEATAANFDGCTMQIRVNDSPMCEFQIRGNIGWSAPQFCIVIPFGDGILFTYGQTVGWYIVVGDAQGYMSAGFIGERI